MGFLDKINTPTPPLQPVEAVREEPTRNVEVPSEKKKVVYSVVAELPTQVVRAHTLDDGTLVKFITVEEALSEIMNSD